MYTGLIAKRYATALADYAEQKSEDNVVFREVETLLGLQGCSFSLNSVFEMPLLGNDEKIEVIAKLLGGTISSTFRTFLQLVMEHKREAFMSFILHSYINIHKKRNGILGVELTTAAPVDESVVNRIIETVKEQTRCFEVQLKHTTDEEAIGGYSLRVGDKFTDQTIAAQLSRIRKQMVSKNKRIV